MRAEDLTTVVSKIVTSFMACANNLALYPAGHPQTSQSIEQLWRLIFSVLRAKSRLVLNFSESEIFFEHDLLVYETLSCQSLIDACAAKKINRLVFLPGLTQRELTNFLKLFNKDFASTDVDFAAELEKAGIAHMEIKRLVPGQTGPAPPARQKSPIETNQEQYYLALAGLSRIFNQAHSEQPIAIDKVDVIVDWLVGNIASGDSTIVALTALKDHDEYTCHHSINVAILATALGHKLGLDKRRLAWLAAGALLHDIGKINIPKEIINKPGRLTAGEWQIMKNHPIESTQILSSLPTLEKSALIVAFEHHIGYDLSGYPVRAERRPPHLFSRIVQITDTYDGLTSKRSYHDAYLPTEALNYMFCVMPKAFDPILLKLFVTSLGVYPVGSVVKLNTGQPALVVDGNDGDLLKPKVKIFDKTGSREMVDLSASPAYSIDQVLSPDSAEIDLAKELIAAS